MNIAFVCKEYIPSKRAGGIASYIHDMAQGLVAAGHSVTVVTASDDTRRSTDAVEEGIRVIRLSGGDFCVPAVEGASVVKKLRCVYRFHSYRRKVARTVAALKGIDIVEVADYGAESLCLDHSRLPIVLRLHTPALFGCSSLDIEIPPLWQLHRSMVPRAELKIFRSCLYVSSCSQSLLDTLEEKIAISPRKAVVIRNPALMHPEVARRRYATKPLKVFFAGTIAATKGVGDLIAACETLRAGGVDLQLVMAGKMGTYAEGLRRRESGDWITFCGLLRRDELFEHYADSAVCCFPSWWENMPMVCLEAMSCGAVVIGSTSGGMKEIIRDGVNGFLVDRKSPAQLAEKLRTALELSPEARQAMVAQAQKTIREDFSIQKIVGETVAFYQEVIDDFNSK